MKKSVKRFISAAIAASLCVFSSVPSMLYGAERAGNSTHISYGACITGSIESLGEVDNYTFDGNSGDVVVIRMRSSWQVYAALELYDPGGTRIASDAGSYNARIDTVTLPTTGRYTILAMDSNGNSTGDYGLSLQRTFDPGGADSIGYGTNLQASIDLWAEMDAYTFDGNSGDVVVIWMSSSWQSSAALELYDLGGTRIASDAGSYNARIDTVTLPTTGKYTILAMDSDGSSTGDYGLSLQGIPTAVEDFSEELSYSFILVQNYPNPFNPETNISYALPKDCHVKITIYNMLGQKIKVLVDEHQTAGYKYIHWDGKNYKGNEVASGIYFYRIEAGEFTQSKKMVILK